MVALGMFAGTIGEVRAADVVQSASSDAPIVYHYPERYQGTVDQFERRAGEAVSTLAERLQLESVPTIDVWVLPTVNEYFERKGQSARAPKWAIGLSLSDEQTVVVAHDTELPGTARPELSATFVHELAHVAIDLARDGQFVPRWFNEGFSLLAAEEWTNERNRTLSRAASTDSLMSLSELTNDFPAHHQVASLAYAQSYHIVRRIGREYGTQAYGEIIKRVADGMPFDAAFREVTGVRLGVFEHRWRKDLTEGSSWWTILMEDGLVFFGGVFLFIIAYVVVQRRRRRQFDEMDDDATPGDADYDTNRYPLPGDPRD
jgi:hypothetical protein